MGVGGAQNWKADKKYKANSLVYTNEKLYICMEDHTSGTDFATDLLSGKWKFIGNGIGSNVSKTVLYEGNVHVTAANTDLNPISHTMSDDMTNYDYIIITLHNSGAGRFTVVAKPIIGDYYPGKWSADLIGADGKTPNASYMIRLFDSRTIYVGLYRPNVALTGWTYIYVESVVGIKIQELTTDYLASLSMPSDVYETIAESASNTYVMSNDGYFSVEAVPSSTDITGQIQILSDKHIWASSYVPAKSSYSATGVTLCIKAGDTVSVRKSSKATNYTYKLIYTVGAAKALGLID